MNAGLALLLAMTPLPQDPQPGIALELARARAQQLRDVDYGLTFTLDERMTAVKGSVRIHFTLPDERDQASPVVLDFAGSDLADVAVNGREPEGMRAVNGHLILPAASLTGGPNAFTATFTSAVAASGTPLTVYRDPSDGREFYYTLVVPADAHRLYPCFDQPDLKARFVLHLDVPADWQAVANAPDAEDSPALVGGRRKYTFRPTQRISTYLMAFAAGPFHVASTPAPPIPGADGVSPLRLFVRPSQRELLDQMALVRMHVDALRWLADWFSVPYPFEKLDVVLVPGFPYGGMEHAGAIFYREQSLLFDHPPTASELVNRSTLIYHELSHQWFGNLVTMRWFDDLWLKEGFATFLSYQCLDALEPGTKAWLRFHQRVRPRAQEVDATPGTTPVYQALGNLAEAKSAYGPIVYNKAPAVLKELYERLGQNAFRSGLHRYLEQHAYGSAEWRDLAEALEASSGKGLDRWSQRWLLSPSLPQVRVAWSLDRNGIVEHCTARQQPVGTATGTWPLRFELLVWDLAGGRHKMTVDLDGESVPVRELEGRAPPACVLIDPGALAYGQFLPDAQSREWLLAHVLEESDVLVRAVATGALFAAVREGELDPLRFVDRAVQLVAKETDAETHAVLLGALATCLRRWVTPGPNATARLQALAGLLLNALQEGMPGRELQTFRFLARNAAEEPAVQSLCRRVAALQDLPPGLKPGKADRFLAAAALLAAGAKDDPVARVIAAMPKEDTARDAFLAAAATPDAKAKTAFFNRLLDDPAVPEQWAQDCLDAFHWQGQEALTLPFLRPGLERVPWIKTHRRIFFLPAWIDGFVNGHSSPEALAVVREWLGAAQLDADVRQKALQSLDGLERAVRLRARWQR
jgi:aminopeptidase N